MICNTCGEVAKNKKARQLHTDLTAHFYYSPSGGGIGNMPICNVCGRELKTLVNDGRTYCTYGHIQRNRG